MAALDFDPFDFCDDDWTEAVVSVAAGLPDREPDMAVTSAQVIR